MAGHSREYGKSPSPQLMGTINSSEAEEEKEPLLGEEDNSYSLQRQWGERESSANGCAVLKRQGANEIATFFNFVKASIGSGSFALPWGILQAGIVVGSLGMILLGIASVYTMQLMLECKRYVVKDLPPEKRKSLNYTEVGRRAMGPFGKWAVDLAVMGGNLGVCAGYMIFIASNLRWAANCFELKTHPDHNHTDSILNFYSPLGASDSGDSDDNASLCFSVMEVYAMFLPVLILLTFLPSFRILAYSAYIGMVFLVLAMVVIYVFGGIQNHVFCAIHLDNIKYVPSDKSGLALWFGVTAFLFCVHAMVIPLESVMKHPGRMQYVLDAACTIVLTVNVPFALYGYLLFGSATQGYIFENLPGGGKIGVFYDLVRVFLSIELTLTFPIVLKPASDIAEEIWYNTLMFITRHAKLTAVQAFYGNKRRWARVCRYSILCGLRTLLVLVSWGIAVGIPRFEICLALVGSLATTIIAFVLPPLFHLSLKWRETVLWRHVFHVCLLVAGILVSATATSINLYTAIKHGSSHVNCTSIRQQCRHTGEASDYCYREGT